LPEGIGGLTGLRTLNLSTNRRLTALPVGLGRLRNLTRLDLGGCPGLAAIEELQCHSRERREGLRVLLAHLATQGAPAAAEGQL
jgi:hypothetical protein